MKKHVIGVAITAVMASSAMAADLPVKAAAPVRGCAAAAFDGGYVGVNGGGVWWSTNRTDQDALLGEVTSYNQKGAGGVVGGQIGYNWTRCNTLIGLEADGDWTSASITTRLLPNTPGIDVHIKSEFDALVTQRVRAGLVLDDVLLYVTAGAAEGHFRTEWTNNTFAPPPVVLLQANLSEWAWGVVAGFGAEWALGNHLSVRSEVLYADFIDRQHSVVVPGFGPANFTHGDNMWVARLGLNWQFNGR
jgi:outer membrane immunogenic protein